MEARAPRPTTKQAATERAPEGKKGPSKGWRQQSLQADVKQAHLHSKGPLPSTNTPSVHEPSLGAVPVTRLPC